MTYLLIGSGNMARFLGHNFNKAGIVCKGVFARNAGAAKEIAGTIGAEMSGDLNQVKEQADCCMLAISDSAIATTTAFWRFSDMMLVHCSGMASVDVMPSEHRGVLWPVYSIARDVYETVRPIPIVWEGNTAHGRYLLQTLATALSPVTQEATLEQRQHLHLAAVFANNFTNHLLTIVQEICREHQLSEKILQPLLEQTWERRMHPSIDALQTGPARRSDQETMRQHLQLLHGKPTREALYQAFSQAIMHHFKVLGSAEG